MKNIIVLLFITLVAFGGDCKLSIDSWRGFRLDGRVCVGRFVQSKDGTILVARMRKPRNDEYGFIKEELQESPYDTEVLEQINGLTIYITWRYYVTTCIGDGKHQKTLSLKEELAYVEEHGGDWCRRGDVYGVQEGRIKFHGWCSYRTTGWDGKNGDDAVWGEFRSNKMGWPLPASFEEGEKQRERMKCP